MMEKSICISTPIGPIGITATETAVTAIRFGGIAGSIAPNTEPLLQQAAHELEEYFAGTRRAFTIALAPAGTPFQQAVWQALQSIPYGQTRTYKQIAEQIERPAACRAVGMANNRNPIAIVIPCHRVVGQGGALVGYAAGLEAKSRLLALEQE